MCLIVPFSRLPTGNSEIVLKLFLCSNHLLPPTRLNTVMDSSKVLVMDAGHVEEFDTVPNLLANKDSSFNAMINATGKEMARSLRRIAEEV